MRLSDTEKISDIRLETFWLLIILFLKNIRGTISF